MNGISLQTKTEFIADAVLEFIKIFEAKKAKIEQVPPRFTKKTDNANQFLIL